MSRISKKRLLAFLGIGPSPRPDVVLRTKAVAEALDKVGYRIEDDLELQEVVALVRKNQKIAAIKQYRHLTQCGLSVASQAVDIIVKQIYEVK